MNLNYKLCNRLQWIGNRLLVLKIQISKWRVITLQINNCVIDYTTMVIDYHWEFLKMVPNSHIFAFNFWMAIKGLYICDLDMKFSQSFYWPKSLILSKEQIVLSSKNSLAKTIRHYEMEKPLDNNRHSYIEATEYQRTYK